MYGSEQPVVASLREQARRLQVLMDRMHDCQARLPYSSEGVWRGTAHAVYSAALHGLSSELAAAVGILSRAHSQSNAALAAMAAHG